METIINTLFPILCSSLCGYMAAQWRRVKRHSENVEQAVVMLLRERMHDIYEKYKTSGQISTFEAGRFNDLFDVYAAMGGNGQAKIWKNEINQGVR